ncbi:MAG: sigma-70 family RNA polymerase sigma factor [Polyangiaceae bacterium]|nr:sigma-70 family RNA polymerase sigma factor [Polyangiaceae bacterium]
MNTQNARRSEPAACDEELVKRVANGDRAALSALYDRYSGWLWALAKKRLGSQTEAEDIVHDVYIEVWRQAHQYSPEKGTVRAWLSIRVRSRVLDRLKQPYHRRRATTEVGDLAETLPAQDNLNTLVQCAQVQTALSMLPVDQREVLQMFYLDGLSLAEISQKLTLPTGTVKSRASRGLSKLRSELSCGQRPTG